ncbi:MAG: hypothetical protein PHI31_07315 [Desulfuromonadaceae bacterium]|nr:hypothetical protein [Desulfuromonadaceae bacterium]
MNNFSPENLTLLLFILNIFLILLDVSLGYHLAPRLLRLSDGADAEMREIGIRTVRRLLTALVVLYMFFNCLGYFNDNNSLLVIVTALVVCDLIGQLYLRRRSKRRGEES